ncbi:MAG: GcrA family cell cycle regulator [Caulobacteraceae bacterium]
MQHYVRSDPHSLMRQRSCLWPIGTPGTPGYHQCGQPSAGRYCEPHSDQGREGKRVETVDRLMRQIDGAKPARGATPKRIMDEKWS